MVNVDCAFRMGRTHLVCQDYAAVAAGEFPCVLLADGCSGSPDTDMGARLLVRSALSHLPVSSQHDCASPASHSSPSPTAAHFQAQQKCADWGKGPGDRRSRGGNLHEYHQQAVCDARKHADALHLSDMALDATLLTLMVSGSQWIASVFGDGVVAAMDQAGEMEVTVVSYLGGYPFYPNYLADDARRRALLQHQDNLRQMETFRVDAQGNIQDKLVKTFAADAPCPYIVGNVADYRWVAILSDGVHSFYTTEPDGGHVNTALPIETILPALLAFKTSAGQFAQRRMQKFQQQCASRGWQHHDDMAMGVVYFS